MSECHRTKSLLKGIMMVFKTKGPQVRCIAHESFGVYGVILTRKYGEKCKF